MDIHPRDIEARHFVPSFLRAFDEGLDQGVAIAADARAAIQDEYFLHALSFRPPFSIGQQQYKIQYDAEKERIKKLDTNLKESKT